MVEPLCFVLRWPSRPVGFVGPYGGFCFFSFFFCFWVGLLGCFAVSWLCLYRSGGPPLFWLICDGARGSSRFGVHRGRLLHPGDRRRRLVSRPDILEPGATSPRVD
ncbi:hypothetical protein SLEP1_g892 [Rubroshorea leprosula]|uniref:Uncharacterized protein n=1 Tax=Rubroshorea leprosula TaxID=152421 RepID=A0AAV5HJ16_9ROSI|nr:hypothetical protein SLEP1_g892 [Rubroshorea leprosula]